MTEKNQVEELPPFDYSGVICPHCNGDLPKSLFMRFIKTSFIRYFLFTFCLSFTLMTVVVDLRLHYSESKDPVSINPYQVALILSGVISLLGWLSQRKSDFKKELLKKGSSKQNAQS